MNKNNFALRPPMGWNSYDYYDTTVDENSVKANAEYMAAHLKKYGWEYVVVDIEWFAHGAGTKRDQYQYIPFNRLEMDEYSRLLPDPNRFPSSQNGAGFGPLADYVHALGLKFGIHIMRGIPRIAAHNHCAIGFGNSVTKDLDITTANNSNHNHDYSPLHTEYTAADIADPSSICGWNPDMYGVRNIPEGQAYYDSLIELYASWGVDFIKCDDICNTNVYPHNPYSARHEIEMLAKAIAKSGREIVLSLSPGPALIEQAWHYETYANMWRITDDFWDDWKLLKDMFKRCELWQAHVKPGCYPDCDMLPVGYLGKGFGRERTTNFSLAEQRTMMTLWCLFGSPLMLGAELTKLDEETLALLTNQEILNMLNPAYCPHQICRDEEKAIWTACSDSAMDAESPVYLALFNLSEAEQCISVSVKELVHADSSLAQHLQIKQLQAKQLPVKQLQANQIQADPLQGKPVTTDATPLTVLDLWEGTSQSLKNHAINVTLKPHACAVFRF